MVKTHASGHCRAPTPRYDEISDQQLDRVGSPERSPVAVAAGVVAVVEVVPLGAAREERPGVEWVQGEVVASMRLHLRQGGDHGGF